MSIKKVQLITEQSAHHSVDFDIDNKVLRDVTETDKVRKVEASSYHCLMGRHHLSENDVSSMTNHHDKVENVTLCNMHASLH